MFFLSKPVAWLTLLCLTEAVALTLSVFCQAFQPEPEDIHWFG
jgi:hypothetical protein